MNDPTGLLRNSVEGSHFAYHFSPIYDLFSPFIRLTRSVIPILLFQSVAGSLVAPGLYEIAVDRMSVRSAAAVACVGLLYAPLSGLIYGDPYETCFMPAATIWLAVFVLRRQWIVAFLAAIFLLSIKEDQQIFVAWDAVLALFYAIRQKDSALRNFSILVLLVSAIVSVGYFGFIKPAVAPHGPWEALRLALTADPATHLTLAGAIFGRVGTLAQILLPLCFITLFEIRGFLIALPTLLEVLLPQNPNIWNVGEHYSGAWIGPVLLAWTLGCTRIFTVRSESTVGPRLLAISLFLCFLNVTLASPSHWRVSVHRWNPHDGRLDSIIASIPDGVRLGAGDALYAHLWNREPLAERGLRGSPCFALIDSQLTGETMQNKMLGQIEQHRFGEYHPAWDRSGVVFYKRLEGCKKLEALDRGIASTGG